MTVALSDLCFSLQEYIKCGVGTDNDNNKKWALDMTLQRPNL